MSTAAVVNRRLLAVAERLAGMHENHAAFEEFARVMLDGCRPRAW